jgi:putative MATE family efflux protein
VPAPLRLTSGPITPALLRLAWPVLVSRTLHTLYGVADTFWVGRLGPEAIAAVSTSTFALWTLFSIGDVLIAGVGALVSQAIGARKDDDAAAAARAGLVLALVLGAGIAAAGWLGAARLFDALLPDRAIAALGAEYLSLVSLLAPLFYVGFVADTVYRSCGDSRTPMLIMLGASIANIVLDPLLILGVGPFPRLGVRGAALATIAAECLAVAAGLALWATGRFPLRLRRPAGRPRFAGRDLREILRIGSPWAATGIVFSGVYLLLSRIAGEFGAPALAALGIVNRLESVSYLTAGAVGMGVATMVGQNVGAARPDRAAAAADRGALVVTATSGFVAAVFLVAPRALAGVFTSSPEALDECVAFLRIVALSQPMMCWEIVYQGAFSGTGRTLPPMLVSVLVSIVRIPLAGWLALGAGAGAAGLWWTISLTAVVRGIWVSLWFRAGGWRRRTPLRTVPKPPPAAGPQTPEG